VPEPEERPFSEQVADLFAQPLDAPLTERIVVVPRCSGCNLDMLLIPHAGSDVWPNYECSSCGMGVEVRIEWTSP
jgi:hypothetical protein